MKKNKSIPEEAVAEKIQSYITEGKEVLIKKEGQFTLVSIRYNTSDTDGTKKWRLLLNGNEFLVKEIMINMPTRTESSEIKGMGIKHHIVCKANEISFKGNVAFIK